MMMRNRLLPVLSLCLAQLMVAINVVGSKYLTSHMHVINVLFYRFGIATVFLLLVCVFKEKGQIFIVFKTLGKRECFFITLQGLCAGVLFNGLMLLGLHYTDAAIAGMIISVLPAVIAFGAVIFLREHLSTVTIITTLAAVCGLLVINLPHIHMGAHGYLLGDLIILLALLPEAAYFVLSRFYQNPLPMFHLSLMMNGVNFLCLFPIVFMMGPRNVFTIDPNSFEIVLLTGIASAFFYVFWAMGAKTIPASKASVFTAMGPLLISVIAYIFLGESMSVIQLFGLLLIVASVIGSSQSSVN